MGYADADKKARAIGGITIPRTEYVPERVTGYRRGEEVNTPAWESDETPLPIRICHVLRRYPYSDDGRITILLRMGKKAALVRRTIQDLLARGAIKCRPGPDGTNRNLYTLGDKELDMSKLGTKPEAAPTETQNAVATTERAGRNTDKPSKPSKQPTPIRKPAAKPSKPVKAPEREPQREAAHLDDAAKHGAAGQNIGSGAKTQEPLCDGNADLARHEAVTGTTRGGMGVTGSADPSHLPDLAQQMLALSKAQEDELKALRTALAQERLAKAEMISEMRRHQYVLKNDMERLASFLEKVESVLTDNAQEAA